MLIHSTFQGATAFQVFSIIIDSLTRRRKDPKTSTATNLEKKRERDATRAQATSDPSRWPVEEQRAKSNVTGRG